MPENLYAPRQIRTFTGKYVNIFETDPETISIEDIAHGLSNHCRFGGQLPEFYSVAQHCIECFHIAPDEYKKEALLHDASEAYINDIASPIKKELPDYNMLEYKLMSTIAKKFNFMFPLPMKIKEIDRIMLEKEWNALQLQKGWDIKILSNKEAKEEFLRLFNTL